MDDLTLFIPLHDPAELDGTNYFELHPAELPDHHACWLSGSLFLKDSAFDFFVESFNKADSDFDYFKFQRLDENEINSLSDDLDSFLDSLRNRPCYETIFSRYTSLFSPKIWSQVPIEALATSVISCGDALRNFISIETKKSKTLWVLGM